jgi:hypothetical protein
MCRYIAPPFGRFEKLGAIRKGENHRADCFRVRTIANVMKFEVDEHFYAFYALFSKF